MNSFIGIDIGTSTIKCILVSENGKILGYAKEKNSYLYPAPGRVEFNVQDRYSQICDLIGLLVKKQPRKSNVVAVCISGASGNALLLDKHKKPIGNAVSWLDTRAESSYNELLSPFTSEYIHSVTGWPKIGSFPLSYFAWMKKNESGIYNSATYCITDFIYYNYKLTGWWTLDTSTATNFYLQEQKNRKYHQPFLDFLEIDINSLPEIVKSGEPLGRITAQTALETGLSDGTTVVAGSFDHPSAARGTGMISPGDLLLSCGTSWVGFFPFESRDLILAKKMLIDPFLVPDGPWGAMFSFKGIGEIISQYINLLFNNSLDRFAKFDEAVSLTLSSKNKLCFDLLQTNETPEKYLSKLLKDYTIPEISRAITVCMGILIREKIESLKGNGILFNNVTMVGGFSKSKIWPRVIANILELPIKLIQGEYAGCLGASILAGIGTGLFKNDLDGFNNQKINARVIKLDKNRSH